MSITSANKSIVLSLYRQLLKEGSKFPSYNFREYTIRRVRDAFRENRLMSDKDQILKSIKEAQSALEVVKRQVIIGKLYPTDKIIVEK